MVIKGLHETVENRGMTFPIVLDNPKPQLYSLLAFFLQPVLILRLSRTGRTNFPSYEVTVSEKARHAQTGNKLEVLGHYQSRGVKPVLKLEKERVNYWLSRGATVSETLARLLKKEGIAGMEKFAPFGKKYQIKKKGAEAAKPVAPGALAAGVAAPESK